MTAWEDDQITGADAIHELRAMLGGWVPGTARATTSATAGCFRRKHLSLP